MIYSVNKKWSTTCEIKPYLSNLNFQQKLTASGRLDIMEQNYGMPCLSKYRIRMIMTILNRNLLLGVIPAISKNLKYADFSLPFICIVFVCICFFNLYTSLLIILRYIGFFGSECNFTEVITIYKNVMFYVWILDIHNEWFLPRFSQNLFILKHHLILFYLAFVIFFSSNNDGIILTWLPISYYNFV